jgi:hypothetical protein
LVVNGDHIVTSTDGTYKTDCFEQYNDLRDYTSRYLSKIPKWWSMGNHDMNPVTIGLPLEGERLTHTEIYTHTAKMDITPSGVVLNTAAPEEMYGYLDLPLQKIRVIFLNTSDEKTYDQIGVNDYGMSTTQIAWLFDNALDFTAKTDASEWAVVIFSHIPLSSSGTNFADFLSGLADFKTGTSHTYNTVTYAFNTQGAIPVLCCIGGHEHYDYSTTIATGSILSILTQNVSSSSVIYGEVPVGGIKYDKVLDTADETSYDIFTFDRDGGKIYATRYGVGIDREWSIS